MSGRRRIRRAVRRPSWPVALALSVGLLLQPALVGAHVRPPESLRSVSLTVWDDAARELSCPSGEGRQLAEACEHAARGEGRDARTLPHRCASRARASVLRPRWFPPPLRRRPLPRGGDEGADPS